ncbi:hypothetical protein BU17DRAFT_72588 [Hysterangium stoloniferum]|nr:hypothetical protein BU17DRAFT_72588 [Hysterangium stoloniferum]
MLVTNLKGLRHLLTEQQVTYSTNNRINTSGTCKFARDGPGPPYAIRFAFGMLPLLIYETILCFPIVWTAIQNYGNGYGSSFLSEMVHDSIFTVLCLDLTLYCAPGACPSYRYRLIKGKLKSPP